MFPASALAQQGSQPARPSAVSQEAAAVLARAKEVMGFTRAGQLVIHYRAVAAAEQNYQSDRTYPPFFSAMHSKEAWIDLRSGMERVSTQTTYPGGGPSPAQVSITDAKGAFALVKDQMRPLPRTSARSRYLNAWAVIADWTAAGDARVVGRLPYRDYSRIVLARKDPEGELRLFLDSKTGFPVKLELQEEHYLWGQLQIEYVYVNWILRGGIMMPGSSFRL